VEAQVETIRAWLGTIRTETRQGLQNKTGNTPNHNSMFSRDSLRDISAISFPLSVKLTCFEPGKTVKSKRTVLFKGTSL